MKPEGKFVLGIVIAIIIVLMIIARPLIGHIG